MPSRRMSSNARTPCRSTTTSAKGAGRSLRCSPWRDSGTHAHARNAGLKRHGHSSEHQPSPASIRVVASPTKQPSRVRLTRGPLRRRIQPAVAVACAECRCRAPCLQADGSSRRTGQSGVAGSDGCSASRLVGRQDQQGNRTGYRPQPRTVETHTERDNRFIKSKRNVPQGSSAALPLSAVVHKPRPLTTTPAEICPVP